MLELLLLRVLLREPIWGGSVVHRYFMCIVSHFDYCVLENLNQSNPIQFQYMQSMVQRESMREVWMLFMRKRRLLWLRWLLWRQLLRRLLHRLRLWLRLFSINYSSVCSRDIHTNDNNSILSEFRCKTFDLLNLTPQGIFLSLKIRLIRKFAKLIKSVARKMIIWANLYCIYFSSIKVGFCSIK